MVTKVLYETEFDGKIIQVIDKPQSIKLQIGTYLTQTSMNKKNPTKLQLRYVREMVDILNFVEEVPKQILVLGLGGASIPKYLFEKLPHAKIDVVDIVDEMRYIAYTFFQLPKNERITVITQDAGDYVKKTNHEYDIIFVDVCNDKGVVPKFMTTEFYNDLVNPLRPNGYIVFNALLTNKTYGDYMKRLRNSYVFVHEHWRPNLSGFKNNHIAFCR
tara:strand:+ start:2819 stop:3466 length:648 start_codon:yes stop_codon:yes gene_type:complete